MFFSSYTFQKLCFMQCGIKQTTDFRAHKNTQCFGEQFPILYLTLFTLSINSHLPTFGFKIHVYERSFVTH
jgi:hypothetical protein